MRQATVNLVINADGQIELGFPAPNGQTLAVILPPEGAAELAAALTRAAVDAARGVRPARPLIEVPSPIPPGGLRGA